jgi:ArsR family transcriptional regulator
MAQPDPVRGLGALAHDHRLKVFRMLVRAGAEGLNAGEIARRLAVPPSSLSFHLSQLESAGLVGARRDQRKLYYSINSEAVRALLFFLTEDCCDGRPELCGAAPRQAEELPG